MLGNQTKLLFVIGLVLVVAFALLAYVLYLEDRERLHDEVTRHSEAIARTVERMLASRSSAAEQALCESLVQLDRVRRIELYDGAAAIAAHADREHVDSTRSPVDPQHVRRILAGEDAIETWDDRREIFIRLFDIRDTERKPSELRVAALVVDTSHIRAQLTDNVLHHLPIFAGALVLVLVTSMVASRRIEAALAARQDAERSAARLGAIIDASDNEVYVFDAESLRFESANEGARRNLGYTMDELRPLTPVDLKPIDRAEFEELIAPLRRHGADRLQFDTEHRRKDGTSYPVQVNLSMSRRGEDEKFVAMILDQTERRKAEAELRQAQKMEAVGQLSAGVAHDFNNLLTAIQGSVDLMRIREEDDSVERELDRIDDTVRRAAALTRKLLAFGRRQPNAPIVLDLNDVIEKLLPILRRLIREDVRMEYRPSEKPAPVLLDPGNLEQIVTNLVINARDAMPAGGSLTIAVETTEPGRVRLSVRDDGEGIPEAIVERVFDPFFTTKLPGKGTGLGLSTVHGIVEQAGGVTWIESVAGHGTKVLIELPRTDQPVAALPNATELDRHAASGECILVCEDDPEVLATTARNLASAGYRTLKAGSAAEALAIARSEQELSLLLTDVVMPDSSGYDLADALRALRPGIAVLFMSGYDPSTDAHGNWPATSVIEKPFSIDRLLTGVQQALRAEPGQSA